MSHLNPHASPFIPPSRLLPPPNYNANPNDSHHSYITPYPCIYYTMQDPPQKFIMFPNKDNHNHGFVPPPLVEETKQMVKELQKEEGEREVDGGFVKRGSRVKCRKPIMSKFVIRRNQRGVFALPPRANCTVDFEVKENSHGGVLKTTMMMKNIPNKLDKMGILEMLDDHCFEVNKKLMAEETLSEFDFLYLPFDFGTDLNLGYAFINFTTPIAASRFYHQYHKRNWDGHLGCRKICEVTYARVQGVGELLEHFKKMTFPCANEEYLPVHFTPISRNGSNRLTSYNYIGRHFRRFPELV